MVLCFFDESPLPGQEGRNPVAGDTEAAVVKR
jgi:hypothetical protein